jgi:hypothetical protein
MAEIITRVVQDSTVNAKGTMLTNEELDGNFINLNRESLQTIQNVENNKLASDAAVHKLKMQVMLNLL